MAKLLMNNAHTIQLKRETLITINLQDYPRESCTISLDKVMGAYPAIPRIKLTEELARRAEISYYTHTYRMEK